VVIEPLVVVELRKQLLVRERELDEWENALLAREHGMVEEERPLGRARIECDAKHDRTGAIQQDYRAKVHTSIASQRCSLEFNRVLSGCQFILSVQETDLECQEEKLAEDQARGLCPPDGNNQLSELGKLRERMAEAKDNHTALVDLNIRCRGRPKHAPYSGCSFATAVGQGYLGGVQSHLGAAMGGGTGS
jgi:hypothetical protein